MKTIAALGVLAGGFLLSLDDDVYAEEFYL